MVAAADAIDAKAPQREEYVKAAKNFRMPYWDWARPASPDSVFPEVALSNTLPKSKVPYVTKRNPLYAFTWPEGVDDSNITLVRPCCGHERQQPITTSHASSHH